MSQITTIYRGMSQDLIEIHKLHLVQARTPVVDFSPFDSSNRLELTYINPSLAVSYSFFHTSSFLLFFIITWHSLLRSHTTMIPHHRHHPSTPLMAHVHTTMSPRHRHRPSTPINVIVRQHRHCPSTQSLSINTVIVHQHSHCPSTQSLSVNTVTVRQHRHYPPTPSLIAKTLKRLSHWTGTFEKAEEKAWISYHVAPNVPRTWYRRSTELRYPPGWLDASWVLSFTLYIHWREAIELTKPPIHKRSQRAHHPLPPTIKEAIELINPQILKMPLSQPSFTTDTKHKRSPRAHRPFLKEAKRAHRLATWKRKTEKKETL
jgi:hypothetical protein